RAFEPAIVHRQSAIRAPGLGEYGSCGARHRAVAAPRHERARKNIAGVDDRDHTSGTTATIGKTAGSAIGRNGPGPRQATEREVTAASRIGARSASAGGGIGGQAAVQLQISRNSEPHSAATAAARVAANAASTAANLGR